MPTVKFHLDVYTWTYKHIILETNADLSGGLNPAFYNYSLIYSFKQMFIEYPLKYANILFWVTEKEATYMDGKRNRFKIYVQKRR